MTEPGKIRSTPSVGKYIFRTTLYSKDKVIVFSGKKTKKNRTTKHSLFIVLLSLNGINMPFSGTADLSFPDHFPAYTRSGC